MKSLPNTPPEQWQVDGIALFTQAAREMHASPFFSEDYGKWEFDGYITPAGDFEIKSAHFPSAKLRDSALLTFRRIWMPDEPSYFRKTLRDLKRYAPHLRPLAESYEADLKKHLSSHIDHMFAKRTALSPEQIIDLWLNSRLAHSGATASVGKYSRADFEAHARTTGSIAFEMLFLQSIQSVGGDFICINTVTEQLLNFWGSSGIFPSFEFDNLNQDGRHVYEDGSSVTRSSPGLIIEQETPTARIIRLIDRHTFDSLKSFFEVLGEPFERLAGELIAARNLDAFLLSAGFKMCEIREINDHPRNAQRQRTTQRIDTGTNLVWQAVSFDTKEVFLDKNALTVLNHQIGLILSLNG